MVTNAQMLALAEKYCQQGRFVIVVRNAQGDVVGLDTFTNGDAAVKAWSEVPEADRLTFYRPNPQA